MILIGGLLIYLALAKDFEPALLMPMGFGAILVNIRGSAQSEPPRTGPRHCPVAVSGGD